MFNRLTNWSWRSFFILLMILASFFQLISTTRGRKPNWPSRTLKRLKIIFGREAGILAKENPSHHEAIRIILQSYVSNIGHFIVFTSS
jgi:hypothetical protein